MRGLFVTEGRSGRRLPTLTFAIAFAIAFAVAVALSLGAVSAQKGWALSPAEDQYGDGEEADDAQYEDGESTGQTSGEDGPCAGAAEQLSSEQPNVPDGTFESYLNYIPDVDGCLTFEGTDFVGGLSVSVYDPETGEELGILKDLDPDLTGGDFSVTYEEFCGAFPTRFGETEQEYFEQSANDKERAILDPDGDGLACSGEGEESTPEGVGEPSGEDGPCAGVAEQLNLPESYPKFVPDVDGCVIGQDEPPPFGALYAPVYDPETGAKLGLLKELDPDLTGGAFSVTHREFCGAFLPYYTGTAQQYFDGETQYSQGANDKERAILDPNGDGLACTDEDEEFLAGGNGEGETGSRFEQTWTGQITETEEEDGTVAREYGIEADIMPISEMTEDLVGEAVGEVSYSLGCGGVWVLEGTNEASVLVEEQIVEGLDNCVESVPITLTPQGDGTLKYYFESTETIGDVGEGVLTLQGSGVPNGGMYEQQPVPVDDEEPPPFIYQPIDFTKHVADNPRGFVVYCGGVMSETFEGISRGRLPETGGGWTALLFSGIALFGGGWFLVRLARRFSG